MRARFRRIWDRLWRRLLSIGAVRRWYARRLVKYIDKSKEKRRGLTGDLAKVDGMTRAMPKAERLKTVEKLLEPVEQEQLGREMRRAAARQGRASGHGTA